MKWDKALFTEVHETLTILPPKAGIPPGLDKYLKDGVLHQPLVRRKNVLTGEWSHMNMARADRPMTPMELKMETKDCLFCPGNEHKTPCAVETGGDYLREGTDAWTLRAFPNLYPWMEQHLNIVETATHKTSMSELDRTEELAAWKAAAKLTREMEERGKHVMLFRNQGWGASIAHYHWQVGGIPHIPRLVAEELITAEAFHREWDENIFTALIDSERASGERLITEDAHTAVLAAYSPRTACEVWILPKAARASLSACTDEERESLCDQTNRVLKALYAMAKIDTMNIIFHQLPQKAYSGTYRLHIEILPYKLMGGAERGFGEFAIEVTPERATELIRKAMNK